MILLIMTWTIANSHFRINRHAKGLQHPSTSERVGVLHGCKCTRAGACKTMSVSFRACNFSTLNNQVLLWKHFGQQTKPHLHRLLWVFSKGAVIVIRCKYTSWDCCLARRVVGWRSACQLGLSQFLLSTGWTAQSRHWDGSIMAAQSDWILSPLW